MRLLQIANAVLLCLGLTFAVTLGVVAVLLAFYVGEYPRYAETLDGVIAIIGMSVLMTLAGALCFRSLQRRWPMWPAMQVLGWGTAAVVVMVGLQLLGV